MRNEYNLRSNEFHSGTAGFSFPKNDISVFRQCVRPSSADAFFLSPNREEET